MIELENVDVYGWEATIRGMRNPMNSHERSDSIFDSKSTQIGSNDHDLMMRLASAGSVHAKYRRMITVTVDITAPMYWWKEFDTYKVGTVRNSTSTMHKIASMPFEMSHFSCDRMDNETKEAMQYITGRLETLRLKFLETKDKQYWYNIIQLLPSSYNQKATVQLNYEVLVNIYHFRKNHKLDEWRNFCVWIESLPYSEIITA